MGYRDGIDDPRYWADRKARMDAEDRYLSEYRLTDGERLDRAIRQANATSREYGHTDEEIAAAHAKVQAIKADIQATEDATWTREITTERRAAWNALATSPEYRGKQGAMERRLGFGLEALKRQVKRWAL